MNTFQLIYELITQIPVGKVTTYGTIAKKLGLTNPRIVGYALHANKNPQTYPCHRVVNKNGELAPGYAFGGATIQEQILKQEQVVFLDEKRVNLAKSFHQF